MKNICICACFLLFLACVDSSAGLIQQKLEQLSSIPLTPAEVENELLLLEGSYPNHPLPKLKLGIFFVKAGQFEKAEIYLNRIHHPDSCLQDDDISDYYLSLAQLALFRNDIPLAKKYVETLGQSTKFPDESLKLVNARIHLLENDKDAAFSLFSDIWHKKELFLLPDLHCFLTLSIEQSDWSLALSVVQTIEQSIGYSPAYSTAKVMLYEKMEQYEDSLISAFLELDARYKAGVITLKECEKQLDTLFPGFEGDSKLIDLKRTLTELLSDSESFESSIVSVSQNDDIYELKYIHFLEKLKIKEITQEDIIEFSKLAQVFRLHPGYHIALWRGMQVLPDAYCLNTAQPVLEHIIQLCPGADIQKHARRELGRLMGISKPQSEYLLIKSEVNAIAQEYTLNGQEEVLLPLLKSLVLENNPYTEYASLIVSDLKQIGEVKNILASLHSQAKDDFKTRLENIINS